MSNEGNVNFLQNNPSGIKDSDSNDFFVAWCNSKNLFWKAMKL